MSTAAGEDHHVPPGWIPLAAFAPLRPAEQVLLRAYVDGKIARVGLRRPVVPMADVSLRGEFVAFLARGGAGDVRFTPRPLQIVGAWIEGRVDLRNAAVPEGLWFFRCVFDTTPRLDGARVGGSVAFPGCLLPGLRAEDSVVAGDLALNSGCTVRTEVRIARATIGSDLNFERLQLRSAESSDTPIRRRLSADGARIDGHALLQGGLQSDGDLRLVGVRLAGDLRASSAHVSGDINDAGQRGDAFNLDQAHVAGSVCLDEGFTASGVVRMKQARIAGDLDLRGAALDLLGDIAWRGEAPLVLDRARIGGTLALQRQTRPLNGASLAAVETTALADDATSWGEQLTLDGFRYRHFGESAPTSAAFRIDWLMKQRREHLRQDFRGQPWQQLIGALRRMGRDGAARDVAVAREAQRRRSGQIGAGLPLPLRALAGAGHQLLGAVAGYGYRPLRVVGALIVLWLACGAVYWAAAENGAIAPADPAIYNDPRLQHCRGAGASSDQPANWTRCPELPAEHPAFRPFAYSLDLLLPFVDLRQRERWTPLDTHTDAPPRAAPDAATWSLATRLVGWYESLAGWIALGLLAWWLLRRPER